MNNIDNINISSLEPGEEAVVTAVEEGCPIKRRLTDMGLTGGTRIMCVGKSPFGDPKAYLVRGAVIAVRRGDCAGVICERQPAGEAYEKDSKSAAQAFA